MLTNAENELLCRVEGDAPMGQLMRRHWVPAVLSEQLVRGREHIEAAGQAIAHAKRDVGSALGALSAGIAAADSLTPTQETLDSVAAAVRRCETNSSWPRSIPARACAGRRGSNCASRRRRGAGALPLSGPASPRKARSVIHPSQEEFR